MVDKPSFAKDVFDLFAKHKIYVAVVIQIEINPNNSISLQVIAAPNDIPTTERALQYALEELKHTAIEQGVIVDGVMIPNNAAQA